MKHTALYLLKQSPTYPRYAAVMVKTEDGRELTTVGNMLVEVTNEFDRHLADRNALVKALKIAEQTLRCDNFYFQTLKIVQSALAQVGKE